MILVTGGPGSLPSALAEAAPVARAAVRRVGRPALDFDRPESIARGVRGDSTLRWW